MRRDISAQALLMSLILLCVAIGLVQECAVPPTQAAFRGVEVLRVQPLGDQVQVSVLVLSDGVPDVSTTAATRVQVFPASGSDGARRTTITATLDHCDGRLVVRDGADVWQWRPWCAALPLVGAP